MPDCAVCYLPCDPAIHAATLSIRAHLRASLKRKLEPLVFAKPKFSRAPAPELAAPDAIPVPRQPRQSIAASKATHGKGEGQPKARSRSWNKMPHVTIERIVALKHEGLTDSEVAAKLRCGRYTIVSRMTEWRRSSPEASAADDALHTCGCGRRKRAKDASCGRCKRVRTLVKRGKAA